MSQHMLNTDDNLFCRSADYLNEFSLSEKMLATVLSSAAGRYYRIWRSQITVHEWRVAVLLGIPDPQSVFRR